MVISTAEMKQKLLLEPQKYPLMLFNKSVSANRIDNLKRVSHIFPVQHKGLTYNGLVPNHFKPAVQVVHDKLAHAYSEQKEALERHIFEEVVEIGQDTFMLFSNGDVVDQYGRLFIVKEVMYDHEIRVGVLCAYHQGVGDIVLKPAGAGEIMVFDVTME